MIDVKNSDATSVPVPEAAITSTGPLARVPAWANWAVLVAMSALFAYILSLARLPAALLLGPMFAGIAVETLGGGIRVHQTPFLFAQAIIGALVATMITGGILHEFAHAWLLFLTVGLVVIVAACAIGWVIGRMGLLPGTTAIWGLLPGAATAMMVMAEAYGADARLVAFMQYTRVALVVLGTSVIARWVGAGGAAATVVEWFPPLHGMSFAATMALIVGGGLVGQWTRLPAGVLLVTLTVGAVLHLRGTMDIELPHWLLAMGYACVGWQIGLRFTREVVIRAARALPQTIAAIVVMMAFCAGVGAILGATMGIDQLSAFLATSPGGVDAIAIIAAGTKVDVGFIMAMQCARLLMVLFIGPSVSRYFANRVGAKAKS